VSVLLLVLPFDVVSDALDIPMMLLQQSGAVWTDGPSNVSRPDQSGADQIDAEHQSTDLAVGPESGRCDVELDH
jgi:hypothetical protein